jgi:hypothetical protein
MAAEALPNGTAVLITVETAVPGTYTAIGSQRGCSITENLDPIDVSSKDNREAEFIGGRYNATMECNQLYIPADAAYILLLAALRGGENIRIERSENGADVENIDAVCVSLSQDFPDQGEAVVAASFQLSGAWVAAAP